MTAITSTPGALLGMPGAAAPLADPPTARWLAQLWRLSRCTVLLVPGGANPDTLLCDAVLPLTARRAGDQRLAPGPWPHPATGRERPVPGPLGPRPPEVTVVWPDNSALAPEDVLRRRWPGEPAGTGPGDIGLAGRLQRWHARCGGRLMVAVSGMPAWLAGGPALGGFDPEAAAWLALLRHPRLPVHTLLALDEDCEPWLAHWADHWPGLTEQTLRLAAPRRRPSAGADPAATSGPARPVPAAPGAACSPACSPARAPAPSPALPAQPTTCRRRCGPRVCTWSMPWPISAPVPWRGWATTPSPPPGGPGSRRCRCRPPGPWKPSASSCRPVHSCTACTRPASRP